MTRLMLVLSIMVFTLVLYAQHSLPVSEPGLAASYGKIPLSFEANRGQADPMVQFLAHGQGYTMFLRQGEAVLALRRSKLSGTDANLLVNTHDRAGIQDSGIKAAEVETSVIRVRLVGANLRASIHPEDEQITKTNYFIGNDPARWRTDVPNYGRIRYARIYPGIDLVYYGNQRQVEHDFVVAPGGNPDRIALAFQGAKRLRIDPASGDLIVAVDQSGGQSELRLLKPVTYQESHGKRVTILSSFILLAGNRIRFAIGRYNHAQPLIIDPVLVYSTYLGGSGSGINGDRANGIAVDRAGHAYLVGTTYSTDFPITDRAAQSQNFSTTAGHGGTVFVSKFNRTGTALIYSTYLGGSGGDFGYGIALDAASNAFVTGATYSSDFPVTCGAFQTVRAATSLGVPTGFVAKLSSAGHRLRYSTYLGSAGQPLSGKGDVAQAIAVNDDGNAYVTGYTYSPDFPVTDKAFQASFAGGPYISNGFVTKLNRAGTALRYSTYLGGSGSFGGDGDYANAIAIDASGDAFITGLTRSPDFPVTKGAFQTTYTSTYAGDSEAFVTELNPTGASEVYSTFLGGNDIDAGQAIAVDNKGFAYVAGNTYSTNFPVTSGVLEPSSLGLGLPLGFVSKLNFDGTALVYSTYLEGQQTSIMGLSVDDSGTAYVAGTAPPQNSGMYGGFQGTPDALSLPAESTAAFLVKLDPTASVLNYATLIGGSGGDGATSIALDASGSAYLTGYSNSGDFPISAQAFQNVNHNAPGGNAFVEKFALANELNQTAYPPNVGPTSTTFSVFVGIMNVQCSSDPTVFSTFDTCYGWSLAANGSGPSLGGTVNFSGALGDQSSIPGPFQAYPSFTSQTYCYNLIPILPPGPIYLSVSGNYSGDANYQSSTGTASANDPGCPAASGASGTASQANPRRPSRSSKLDVNHPTVLTSNKAPLRNIGPKFLPPPAGVPGIGPVSQATPSGHSAAQSQATTACIARHGEGRDDDEH